MINIGIALGAAFLLAGFLMVVLKMHAALAVPMGLVLGAVIFIVLGRKVQEALEGIMAQMQKDIAAGKVDRAIETLKSGFVYEKRHIFVGAQLNSQIGVLYYMKKEQDTALDYLRKGFPKHFMAQCMMAAIYFKRKDEAKVKEVMDVALSASKKESLVYGIYAWFYTKFETENKDEKEANRAKAIEILQKGLKAIPGDEKLSTNLTQLQNGKKMRMKLWGDMWLQFMLERPPRIIQEAPPHMRVSKKAMYRGR